MTDRNSHNWSARPQARPCIRGPYCQRVCCLTMDHKASKNKHPGNQKLPAGTPEQSESSSSEDDQTENDIPEQQNITFDDSSEGAPLYASEVQGVDSLDGCALLKSSSLDKSERTSPFQDFTSGNGSGDSKRLSNSWPGSAPGFSFNNSQYESLKDAPYDNKAPKETQDRLRQTPTREPEDSKLPIGFIFVILVFIVAIFGSFFNQNSSQAIEYAQSNFQNDLFRIGEHHRIKEETMLKIRYAIETTFNKQDTSSIVFLYDDNILNEAIVKEFVDEVANVTAKFLRNDTGTASPIVVENSDLDVGTVGELIRKYEKDLEDQGVLLVQDLEDIPVNLAMAFHYYCDEYDPLVSKTAIFFTLNLAKCREKFGKTQHEVVESCLSEKWRALEQEKLTPLLTRVVNVVIYLEADHDR